MPRMPRFFVPDVPLHLIQRGNDRMNIFGEEEDYLFFLRFLGIAARRYGATVHGYVLMTNHLHLVVTPRSAQSAPRTMQAAGRVYVAYFNKKYARTGTLWEGRYKAAVIQDEAYLLLCMRYVELNPVRAGMVAHPADYRWSSYAANALGGVDGLVTPHPLYEGLGRDPDERCAAYRELVGAPLPAAAVDDLRDATHHNWAAGDASFLTQVSESSRRAQRLPVGRRSAGECDSDEVK